MDQTAHALAKSLSLVNSNSWMVNLWMPLPAVVVSCYVSVGILQIL